MIPKRLFYIFNILAVVGLLMQGGNYQSGQASSTVTLEGTFIAVWGDGSRESRENVIAYYMSAPPLRSIRLFIENDLLTSSGGLSVLDRRDVIVQGTWLEEGFKIQVQSLALAPGGINQPEGVYGPQPWVSILCKFSDIPDEPKNLGYFQGMYSPNYPGLDHHWREQSFDLANLLGSGAFGWYVLPHPRSYYFDGSGNFQHGPAAQDCTAAADPTVDFSPYIGINLMFNAVLDCCAWGGGWYGCLDGICKVWSMTWEPPWGYENIAVMAHETGHGFGLPHSSGNYGQTYDNQWDLMSDCWAPCDNGGVDPTYGCLGQHTISYHKNLLGWIEQEQLSTVNPGTIRTITLERLALPQTENYLAAFVPVYGSPNRFLTVDARQLVGYDSYNHGAAVIIHEVDPNHANPANVIDIDGNGNTGDEGAMWIPGETYITPTLGIEVSVLSATDTGYIVSINNQFNVMQGIEISGPDQGYIDESITFTATVSPEDATTPITYTWEATDLPPVQHVGGTLDTSEFTWDEVGSKTITVTASNAGGTVTDTGMIELVLKVPVVSISGPALGGAGAEVVFMANVEPLDVVQPITYTWLASGQLPITHTNGLSDTISYVWDEPGTQVITVTARNIVGETTDTYILPVLMPPADLEIMGPGWGDLQTSYTFTAEVSPITTTVPITYVWNIDGQGLITHTAGLSDSITVSWDDPGLHSLSVEAINPVGGAIDTWMIAIHFKVYLPLNLRN